MEAWPEWLNPVVLDQFLVRHLGKELVHMLYVALAAIGLLAAFVRGVVVPLQKRGPKE